MHDRRIDSLRKLARLYGIQTVYEDVFHQRQQASPDSLLQALRILGAAVHRPSDAGDAYRRRLQEIWSNPLEPVVCVWEGRPAAFDVRIPESQAEARLECELQLEGGESRSWTVDLAAIRIGGSARVEGTRVYVKRVPMPEHPPIGYHQLRVTCAGRTCEALLLSAPARVYTPPGQTERRQWGLFAPLYALHSAHSWGIGDLTDLEQLMHWVAEQGGSLAATLPLLSMFYETPGGHSPYAPVSRLFWNEIYLDVERIAGSASARTVRDRLNAPETRAEIAGVRELDLIDYDRVMRLKRSLLEPLAQSFFEHPGERQAKFEAFLREHPRADEYARFRAVGERQGKGWREWPAELRGGRIADNDFDEAVRRYHLFVQWQMDEQVRALADKARNDGALWYLDVPLGVHIDGYDVWRDRDVFALGAAGGAPPDMLFTKGQNWGFPPLHPDKLRAQRYRYWIEALRRQMQYANLLRIDHVMGLHRLFWVPDGLDGRQGVYVESRPDELYAILLIESHRQKCLVVGENLGTVPAAVNSTMHRTGVFQMYVLQYELQADAAPRPAPADSVASLNTHDMPTFAGFWAGDDARDRHDLGLMNDAGLEQELAARETIRQSLLRHLVEIGRLKKGQTDSAAVRQAALEALSTGPASLVLANIEDLWDETEQQNVPGTLHERPNWRRKLRYSFEDYSTNRAILADLKKIAALRQDTPRAVGKVTQAR
ncbi:MAG TPA: 4-alpha-glucanotransferase [Planctomycetaceae bacterium]|nr:4-alpha-glucanotransferase [Planctomycetaceae bacterium]